MRGFQRMSGRGYQRYGVRGQVARHHRRAPAPSGRRPCGFGECPSPPTPSSKAEQLGHDVRVTWEGGGEVLAMFFLLRVRIDI